MSELIPPHSIEAERAVLGAILLHGESVEAAAEILGPSDFYRTGHQRLFAQMLALHHRREPIEMVTLREALQVAGDLDAVGGPVYLMQLVDGLPRSSNIAAYARIVRERATLRELIAQSNRILADAHAGENDAAAVLDAAL